MIRVMLVDDSPVALGVLRRMLAEAPGIEVVGSARNGVEALEILERLKPTVLLTDLHMPKMDGLALTREVMARHPLPILVVSVSVLEGNDNAFALLEAGAIDIFPKPRGGADGVATTLRQELIRKIKVLSGVVPIRRFRRREGTKTATPSAVGSRVADSPLPTPEGGKPPRLVAMGASTGGPQALSAILGHLPGDFPLPILCVQHISEGFLGDMVSWLQEHTPLNVALAAHGEVPRPGWVYFPPEGHHLLVDGRGRFLTLREPPNELTGGSGMTLGEGHRPSVDVLFFSLARHLGAASLAVLLTGMGQDGAAGLLAIHRAGGRTIAQDEESCVVFGMPARAIEMGGARHVLALERIAPALQRYVE